MPVSRSDSDMFAGVLAHSDPALGLSYFVCALAVSATVLLLALSDALDAQMSWQGLYPPEAGCLFSTCKGAFANACWRLLEVDFLQWICHT